MSEPYSPLRYPGGKAKLANFLIKVLQSNGLREPHYVEPYAGGAGAALRLLFEEYVEAITINDADRRVRCFWTAVTTQNDAFLGMLDDVEVSVDEWRRQRAVYDNQDVEDELELGFATFFLNRTTRSGIIHNGGPIGGFDQAGNYKIDARFNRPQLARRIQRVGIYADRIDVSGEDGLLLLQTLNQDVVGARNTLVYLDPPYYAKGAELYLNRFTHIQHRQLAEYLSTPKAFPWVMTYDNVPQIRELYAAFPQLCFNLSYSAYERRAGKELLVHPVSVRITTEARQALPLAA
jgi:DNA adenine methylase